MRHAAFDLVDNLRQIGVQFSLRDSNVHIEAPAGSMTGLDRSYLSENKRLVLAYLKGHWIVTVDRQWVADQEQFTNALTAYEHVVGRTAQQTSRPHSVALWNPTGRWVRLAHFPQWPSHHQPVAKEEVHV